jgi:hypothetical protein
MGSHEFWLQGLPHCSRPISKSKENRAKLYHVLAYVVYYTFNICLNTSRREEFLSHHQPVLKKKTFSAFLTHFTPPLFSVFQITGNHIARRPHSSRKQAASQFKRCQFTLNTKSHEATTHQHSQKWISSNNSITHFIWEGSSCVS